MPLPSDPSDRASTIRVLPLIFAVCALAANLAFPSFARNPASIDAARRLVPITVLDGGSGAGTDTFGVHDNGTYCVDGFLDPDLYEALLPPLPPPGIFDVRFLEHRAGSSCLDRGVRVHIQEPFKLDTFKLGIQAGEGGYPLTIRWPAGLASAGWSPLVLRDADYGSLYYVDMLVETTLVVANESVGDFYIIGRNWLDTPPAGTVTVTSPHGGEYWVAGSTHDITWNGIGVDDVTLEYTTDMGATWNFISTESSTGTHPWLIPNTPSNQCRVRISAVTDSTVNGVSNELFTIAVAPPPATRRLVPITVRNEFGESRTDTFGVHENATYCADGQLDPDVREQQMPPLPPAGVFDVRFVEHRSASACLGTGLRVHLQEAYKLDTFKLNLQPGDIDFPMEITWPAGLAAWGWDSLVIRDAITGTFYNVDMLTDSSLTVVNFLGTSLYIIGSNRLDVPPPPSITVVTPNGGETWYSGSTHDISWTSESVGGVVIDYSTNQGTSWNWIASGPSTGSYSWLVPNTPSTTCLVRIRAAEDLAVGDVSGGTFTILDGSIHSRYASVRPRWNLVSIPLVLENYMKNAVFPTASSQAFSYGGAYIQRDTLYNAGGFWAKFDSEQEILIQGQLLVTDTVNVSPGWNLIGSISDPVAVGSITSVPGGMTTSKFYSYASSYVETGTIEPGRGYWVKVDVAGALILSASGPTAAGNRINLNGLRDYPPPPPGDDEIAGTGIPEKISLSQNYPNPFNPSTTIRFALPAAADVRLAVYNLVGEIVALLIDENQPAGYNTIAWDASAFPSGVYYLRLSAGATVETRKLLLLR